MESSSSKDNKLEPFSAFYETNCPENICPCCLLPFKNSVPISKCPACKRNICSEFVYLFLIL